jgi:hypothetical protein
MFDISLYFRNPFSDNTISDEKLKKFTEDHLNSLSVNNGNGQFTAFIAETGEAYNNYFGTKAAGETSENIQTELNISMRNIFEEFIALITRMEPEIKQKLGGENSEKYKQFFPGGISEYNNATLGNAEELMTRLITAVNLNLNELGQEFLDVLNGLKTNFHYAKESQVKDISVSGNEKKGTRDILEKQLLKNLFSFAIIFIDNPDKGMEMFNVNLLNTPDEGPSVFPENKASFRQQESIK